IVGGAGVDPDIFAPSPLPPSPPLKLAMIARMLWSKGVDTAVEAVRLARAAGADVTLTLVGAPDPDNPRAISADQLAIWAKEPGVSWRGRIAQADAPAVWSAHHAALLPSRGGEGLPRTLLEAGACGRAILTTDVPGCRDLVRDGIEGLVVPPGDATALSRAILRLSHEPGLIEAMGKTARARVLSGHTEKAVGEAVLGLYRRMLSKAG
ncbi:MAG: glycosyltransferase, partial [Beijerinckiaceae bacterium]